MMYQKEHRAQLLAIANVIRQGGTLRDAAKSIGVSTATVYRRLRDHLPKLTRRRQTPLKRSERIAIEQLLSQGCSLREIGAKVNRDHVTVLRIKRRLAAEMPNASSDVAQ